MDHVVVGFGQSPAFYGRDQSAFVWFLAWGARALTHLQNPFLTRAVYAPGGYDLAWAASIPGPALLLAPITAMTGAVPVFNALALTAPACAAWTAYLLCAQLTARHGPPWVGGALFGFGSYETTETVNHLNLALVALLPLIALLALRRYRGVMSRRRYVLTAGLVIGAQLWTSTEVAASAVVFGAMALALAVLLSRDDGRLRARSLVLDSTASLAVACLLVAAPLLVFTTGSNPVSSHSTVDAGGDLANFLTPTSVTWLHTGAPFSAATSDLGGNLSEQLTYIGIPLVFMLLWFAIERRGCRFARGLLLLGLLAAVLSLGGTLIVDGNSTGVRLPWGLIGQIPPLSYALPGRFAVYLWLVIAVVAALWLDRPTLRLARWTGTLVACVSVLPNSTGLAWSTPVDSPPLLKSRSLGGYVHPGSTVLALPFGSDGESMFWQAEAGFSFNLAGGYVSWALPREYMGLTIIKEFTGRPPGGQLVPRLCAFLSKTQTRTILLREGAAGDWDATLGALHISPVRAGGFVIYRLGREPCGRLFGGGGLGDGPRSKGPQPPASG